MHQAILVEPARSRLAWLSNPTLLLCIAGVVLPNALSLGALIAGIGSPPRTTAIIAYALLAYAVRFVPRFLIVVLYLAIAAYDAISTIALLFNLAPSEIGTALRFGAELKLFQSPLYVALISGLTVLVGANIALLTLKRDTLRRGNTVILMSAALLLAGADFAANTSAHYEFGTLYGAAKPMESAGLASGFRPAVLKGTRRNALMVMVEALGQFADPERQAILLQAFRDPELLKRYDVTVGSNTYYGSTTAAEMRELCNTREPYEAAIEGKVVDCLPSQMAGRGYRTVALHNFTSKFFQRDLWYPKLGFQKRIFFEDLGPNFRRLCGGPFRGPCDTDMIPVIASELRDASKPTFFYWMTLGTHVPIAPREGTPRLGCDRGGGAMGQMEVCYMTEMWLDVFQSIAAMTADIPPTDILIVGDHAPPLWSKVGRQLFTPGQVTWVRLTPRAASHVSRR